MRYIVRIIKMGTKEVVKQLGPTSIKLAEKIEDGININLNHDEYYTELIPEETK